MTKLKLGPLGDDKPVRVSIELPAAVYRDLVAYAELLGQTSHQTAPVPAKLIVPMIQRFMATDRAFAKARRSPDQTPGGSAERSG
ncbi:DUF2274 domain-containing protein [Roseixanthobacter glucoisosaccharinicivorans]|uniref:DUF2274 domain-containing protein n=1 Tax=Roseixanthobacter glucoisosaccharinicivorans TaxID=3119923 RepID=UPI003726F05D